MLGQMMQMPLLISSLLEHAERYHGATEIISVNTNGGKTRTHWAAVSKRARQLASQLEQMGIPAGACCATLAWNNHRHLEIYFGVASSGRICHTINPRLFPAQLNYIINHAQDQVLFFDKTFLPLVVGLQGQVPSIKAYILLDAPDAEVKAQLPQVLFYEDLIAAGDSDYSWPSFDENEASSLCYTSGTTGDPKGVLYSHRSTVLHSLVVSLPDSLNISARDCVMPVVPMFHVNAWGIPYAAALTGASLVMPGPGLDGASLVKLIDEEQVTLALGVPTIWQGLLAAIEKSGSQIPSLKRTVIGGAACPPSMMAKFRDYGVETIHAWGMTELSPVGTVNALLHKHESLSAEEQQRLRLGQGRPVFGIELRLVDDQGELVTNDGQTQGNLQCRGPWVVDTYFHAEQNALEDGWFSTGDVATMDADGYMNIRDRSKDIIKSGGEWISTLELENIAIAHPDLIGAAVIAAKHDKWDERPLLIAVRREGHDPSAANILAFFDGKIAKWQTPDAVVFVDNLPLNGTGKLMKNKLRDQYGDYLLQQAAASKPSTI